MLSDESTRAHAWDAGPEGVADDGRRLIDLLERLAAHYHTIHFACPDEIEPARLKVLAAALEERQAGLRLSLCSVIDNDTNADFTVKNEGGAIVHLQWRTTGLLPDLGFFKALSRSGIWNHLVLDGAAASVDNCRAVARQPNIIHSWETVDAGETDRDSIEAYGRVRRLTGRPLWQTANNSLERFLLVDRLTKDRLWRLRIDDDGESLYTVGDALAYDFLPPAHVPDGYLDEICTMVAAGGTVADTHVRFNLERAYLIGYVQEKGVLVGNSSLKNPRPEYIDAVRRQTGLDLTGYVERGYTSVRPEYRGLGIGTRLLEGLTRRAGDRRIFSVIAEDNAATKVIAMRNHTRKVATYFSEKAGKPVGIWMPMWMIDPKAEGTK